MQKLHLVIGISLIFGILLQFILQILSFEWATLLFILLNLTLPFWLMQKLTKSTYKAMPFKSISFATFCEITLLVLFTFPAIQIVGQFLSRFVSNPLTNESQAFSLPMALGVVVLAPFIEEYFFRGLLLRAYDEQGIPMGIFWTSLWFGLYHLSVHQGVYTFLFALLLGGVMNRHQNILVPILVHSGVNGLSYLAGLEQPSDLAALYYHLTGLSSWTVSFQVMYCVGFALSIYFIYLKAPIKKTLQVSQPFKMDSGTWVILWIFVWSVFL